MLSTCLYERHLCSVPARSVSGWGVLQAPAGASTPVASLTACPSQTAFRVHAQRKGSKSWNMHTRTLARSVSEHMPSRGPQMLACLPPIPLRAYKPCTACAHTRRASDTRARVGERLSTVRSRSSWRSDALHASRLPAASLERTPGAGIRGISWFRCFCVRLRAGTRGLRCFMAGVGWAGTRGLHCSNCSKADGTQSSVTATITADADVFWTTCADIVTCSDARQTFA